MKGFGKLFAHPETIGPALRHGKFDIILICFPMLFAGFRETVGGSSNQPRGSYVGQLVRGD